MDDRAELPKPFHPHRLLEQVELLGAGGQLYIGDTGAWGLSQPRTRLLITGVDAADRDRVSRAFDDCLLTAFEASQTRWPATDVLEPWLG